MKKLFLTSVLIFGMMSIKAQTDDSSERKNEIILSPIELIAAPALNISYERLLNENSGVGINALIDLDGDSDNSFSQFSPYYRMYFGRNYASGFFIEGFVPVTTTKDKIYYPDSGLYSNNTRTTIGAGIGFGGKWIVKKNIVFEASVGIARRFGSTKITAGIYDEEPSKITGKGMLGVGYRF